MPDVPVTRSHLTDEQRGLVDQSLEALERVLQAELGDHHALLNDLDSKRDAIRHADLGRISEITQREEQMLRRMTERANLRKQLGERVATLSKLDAAPFSVLVALAGEERGQRLTAIKSELEAAGREVRRRSTIVRSAAEALSLHMAGVLQTVTGALSRAGVYGRRGTMQLGQAAVSSIDVRS